MNEPTPPTSNLVPETPKAPSLVSFTELVRARRAFEEVDGNVVDQIKQISKDADGIACQWLGGLSEQEASASAVNGTFVSEDGREVEASITLPFIKKPGEKPEEITFKDPINPMIKTRIRLGPTGETRIVDGYNRFMFKIADNNDVESRYTAWSNKIIGSVAINGSFSRSSSWNSPEDPFAIVRRGLDFLKTATLKPKGDQPASPLEADGSATEASQQPPPAAPSTPVI